MEMRKNIGLVFYFIYFIFFGEYKFLEGKNKVLGV
jgi:hypothetical protein